MREVTLPSTIVVKEVKVPVFEKEEPFQIFIKEQSSLTEWMPLPKRSDEFDPFTQAQSEKRIIRLPDPIFLSKETETFLVFDRVNLGSEIFHSTFTFRKVPMKKGLITVYEPMFDPETNEFFIPLSKLFLKNKELILDESLEQKLSLNLEMENGTSHNFNIYFKVIKTRGIAHET